MRRALIAVGVLFALLVVAVGVALALFDPKTLREPLQQQATAALGRDVALGDLSLALLPLPAVRVSSIRIAGTKPDAKPFAEIKELRLRVALLPLLGGKVVLRALEVDSPRVYIPFDRDGKPILPGARTATHAGAKPPAPAGSTEPAAPGALALAVDRIAVDDARIEAGPWLVEHANLSGRLSLDGTGAFEFAADLPGLVELRAGELALANLFGDAPEITARGDFGTDLAGLRKRFELGPELSGKARGEYEVELAGGEVRAASANLDVPDLLLRRGDLVVSGPARAHLVLGESYSFDLTDTRVEQAGVFAKPRRTPLAVTGKLGREPALGAVRDALVRIGDNELPLGLELGRTPMRVTVKKTTLDLASLRQLLPPDRPPLSGRLAIAGFEVQLEPLRVTGQATLDGVETELEHGPISLSGPLYGRGDRITLEQATAKVGGQRVGLDASYQLASGAVDASFETQNAALEELVAALSGRHEVSGMLLANGRVSAPQGNLGDVAALRGGGRLDIRPGRIKGFSLVKSVMGTLSTIPALLAAAKGKDLSRYDDEQFQYLTADYTLDGGKLESENLELAYKDAKAYLRGSYGLVDRSLDLSGRIVLSREADAELAGAARAKERVIPISHIGGTIDAPRVVLDQRTLAALALAYTGNDKVREKLDKALGEGGAEAVQDILGTLLGGPKKSER